MARSPLRTELLEGTTYRGVLGNKVLVPRVERRIRSGLWLYASCRPSAIAIHRIAGSLAAMDCRLLPGRRVRWAPPIPPDLLGSWLDRTEGICRTAIRSWVVMLPSDDRRQRFSLLLFGEDGRHAAFAKFTVNPGKAEARKALELLTQTPPTTFKVPVLLDTGTLGGWHFETSTTLPPEPHRPAKLAADVRRRMVCEIQEILDPLRGSNRMVPSHGDFGPWNVRRFRNGDVYVIDWEDVLLAPDGADEMWHEITSRLIKGADPNTLGPLLFETLSPLHDHSALEGAAHAVIARVRAPQPPEVAGVQPSESVLRFQDQIVAAALSLLAVM